jgi:two-component system, cell cycle response regulator
MSKRRSAADPLEHEDPVTLLISDSTLRCGGRSGDKAVVIPTLTFLSGDALGKELPLLRPQVSFGRGTECDVVLTDPAVSRKHVQLTRRKLVRTGKDDSVRVVLQDMGSTNGTLVNYRRVQKAVLKPGDKIVLGQTILKYEHRDIADRNFYDEIYKLATTDGLTGLLNKASIMRQLGDEMEKAQRYRRKLSVLLIDIDNFKGLNDTLGHIAGDQALRLVAEVLRTTLRRQDRAGRFGGEEFLILLPETGQRGAMTSAERIRREIERTVAPGLYVANTVTASIGVASFPAKSEDSRSILEAADAALYRAKGMGKNRTEVWRGAVVPKVLP